MMKSRNMQSSGFWSLATTRVQTTCILPDFRFYSDFSKSTNTSMFLNRRSSRAARQAHLQERLEIRERLAASKSAFLLGYLCCLQNILWQTACTRLQPYIKPARPCTTITRNFLWYLLPCLGFVLFHLLSAPRSGSRIHCKLYVPIAVSSCSALASTRLVVLLIQVLCFRKYPLTHSGAEEVELRRAELFPSSE